MSSEEFKNPIKIRSIKEENRYISRLFCGCCNIRGTIKPQMQSLQIKSEKPYDVLSCECIYCKKKFTITFDISSFFLYTDENIDEISKSKKDSMFG